MTDKGAEVVKLGKGFDFCGDSWAVMGSHGLERVSQETFVVFAEYFEWVLVGIHGLYWVLGSQGF